MTTPPAPPVPEPDDKDWTWVLDRPCPDCGYDAAEVSHDEIPELTRRYADALALALGGIHATQRPEPAVWSPLEYACHVRDVCRMFDGRLRLMLEQDDPLFENWDQDDTATADRYWEQQPTAVHGELVTSANQVAIAFGSVRDDQWQRPGRRSNGSVFTVDTLARYFLHDLAHHAWDVQPGA